MCLVERSKSECAFSPEQGSFPVWCVVYSVSFVYKLVMCCVDVSRQRGEENVREGNHSQVSLMDSACLGVYNLLLVVFGE